MTRTRKRRRTRRRGSKKKDYQPTGTRREWREDATLHEDGTMEGGWVQVTTYEPEQSPEPIMNCLPTGSGGMRTMLNTAGGESFADLYFRLVESKWVEDLLSSPIIPEEMVGKFGRHKLTACSDYVGKETE